MQFHFTRKRLLWGSVIALLFGAVSYNNILTGRWPRTLGVVSMILLPAFALFGAVTADFTKRSTPEEQAQAWVVFRNKMILWVAVVVVTYAFLKLNAKYHMFPNLN